MGVYTEHRCTAGATPSESWGELIALNDEPVVPDFPVDVYPADLATYVSGLARCLNAPVDFVGTALLVIAAGLVGNARRLLLSGTHEQPALIYAAMVGLPGTVKSPVLKFLTAPIDDIQAALNKKFLEEMDEWRNEKESRDDVSEEKPRPQLEVLIARNATTESIALALHYNPRGIVLPFDELAGLFSGLNQYKSGAGNDRQFYLSIWAQETVNILRKSDLNHQEFPEHLRGPWAKLKGYASRLTLVLHLLRWACGEEVDPGEADAESVRRAVSLIAYFKAHCRKVHALMETDPRLATARKVVKWIQQRREGTFSRRDAYQAVKGSIKTVEALDPILDLLANHNIIRPMAQVDRDHCRGRKPSQMFEVNPSLTSGNSGNSGTRSDLDEIEGARTAGSDLPSRNGRHNSHYSQNSAGA